MEKIHLTIAFLVVSMLCNTAFSAPDDFREYTETYSEIIALLQKKSVSDVDTTDIVYSSIDGMLETLDPHSSFLTPEYFREMREKQQGSFYGLGIVISKRDGNLTVISPIEGTPAQRLGIRAGDIISKIEGQETGDMTTTEAVGLLKGPRGTKVKITVVRPGFEEPIEFEITRDEIPTDSIPYSFMIREDIGYIRIRDFTQTTTHELKKCIEDLREEGMEKLLLDLRENPGGLLNQAVSVSSLFLNKGQMVVFTKGRIPGSSEEFFVRNKPVMNDLPLVVLVNTSSASASEIVAGAIQDHDRGLIVGVKTWGKGLVQSVYPVIGEAGLALTTAKYYTPSGRCIQRDYKQGFDQYYLDWLDKSKTDEGEKGPEMFTDHGRSVYANGGITPDEIIEPELIESPYVIAARRKSAYFRFAVEYIAKHSDIGRDIQINDRIIGQFKDFLKKAEIDFEEEDFNSNLDQTKRFIKEEIFSALWGLQEGYRISIEGDSQIIKALHCFPKAEELLKSYN